MMLINSKESLLWYTEVCVQLYQVKKNSGYVSTDVLVGVVGGTGEKAKM